MAPSTTICCAFAGAAQLNPHRLRVTARRTPTHPRIQSIWPTAPIRAEAAATRRHFGVTLSAPPTRLAAPVAGDAARDAALNSTRLAVVGKINGVLQFLLAPANRSWRSVHHFSRPLRQGHANMVDRWLIAVRDQAEKVVRGGENHQERHQRDSDPEADFLRPLAQRASAKALESVKREMAAIQQAVSAADSSGRPTPKTRRRG